MRTTLRVTHRLDSTRPGTLARPHPSAAGQWVAAVGVSGFLVTGVVTGLVTPAYDLRREAISALSALDSTHAGWMIAGFAAGAVGLVASAVVLWQAVPQRAGRVAAGMLAATGALIGVAAFARQDCSDQLRACQDFGEAVEASRSYWVHEYASLLAFLMLLVSFFVLARGLRRTGQSHLAVVSRTVGAACSTAVALLVVAPPFVVDNYGILQRVTVGALFGWPVVAGILASRTVHHGAIVAQTAPRDRRAAAPTSTWGDAVTVASLLTEDNP
jgi:hypothetical protein